ncbi:4'-phosphopantetheinyl transferase domain superfamily protein [Abortiporus biennis]
MGILGIGVDIVHLPRILSLVQRRSAEKLAKRILSTQELADWKKISGKPESQQAQFLAVRWSLKEAAYKALYPAIIPTWKELTFHPLNASATMKPCLVYNPASGVDCNLKLHSSVSHDGDYVFTSILAEHLM